MVTVYRTARTLGMGASTFVECDGAPIAELVNGSYARCEVSPGEHTFTCESQSPVTLELKPGDGGHFLRARLEVASRGLEAVDRSTADGEIAGLSETTGPYQKRLPAPVPVFSKCAKCGRGDPATVTLGAGPTFGETPALVCHVGICEACAASQKTRSVLGIGAVLLLAPFVAGAVASYLSPGSDPATIGGGAVLLSASLFLFALRRPTAELMVDLADEIARPAVGQDHVWALTTAAGEDVPVHAVCSSCKKADRLERVLPTCAACSATGAAGDARAEA